MKVATLAAALLVQSIAQGKDVGHESAKLKEDAVDAAHHNTQ